jgi:hypothetical protein
MASVSVDRWALLHLLLTVAELPEPEHPHERADAARCFDQLASALASPAKVDTGQPLWYPDVMIKNQEQLEEERQADVASARVYLTGTALDVGGQDGEALAAVAVKAFDLVRDALVANLLDGAEGGRITMGGSSLATEAADIAVAALLTAGVLVVTK